MRAIVGDCAGMEDAVDVESRKKYEGLRRKAMSKKRAAKITPLGRGRHAEVDHG
jgi:hypothetical protein